MAVPTITSVSPVTGPSRGQTIVEILGTNFQVPPPPPVTGPVPAAPPTVLVTVAGVPCLRTAVVTSTRVIVQVPPGQAGPAVDIVLANIDPLGVVIPGETVTAIGSYTYVRPPLLAKSALVRLIKTFIRDLKQKVVPEVVHGWASDYYDVSVSVSELKIATFPALALLGPIMPVNRFYSINRGEDVQTSPTSFTMHARPLTVDLKFVIVGMSDKAIELLNLDQMTLNHFNRTKHIDLQRDPATPAGGFNRYELEFSPFTQDIQVSLKANSSNTKSFSLGVEIRGFDIEGLAGLEDIDIIGKGVPVDDINVNYEQI